MKNERKRERERGGKNDAANNIYEVNRNCENGKRANETRINGAAQKEREESTVNVYLIFYVRQERAKAKE